MKNVFAVLMVSFFCFTVISNVQGQISLGKLLKEAIGSEEDSSATEEVEVDFAGEVEAIKNEHPVSFVMEMEEIKKGKSKGKSELAITADTWKTAIKIASNDGNVIIIFNNKKGTMLTVTESKGERSGMEMKQPKIKVRVKDDADYQVTKTGETKIVAGVTCEKYIIEHEDGTTTSWVTDSYGINYGELVAPMLQRMKNSPTQMQELNEIAGIPLESHTISKDGKTETMMYIKNIKSGDSIDRSVFEVSDVKVMSLNFGF